LSRDIMKTGRYSIHQPTFSHNMTELTQIFWSFQAKFNLQPKKINPAASTQSFTFYWLFYKSNMC